METEDPEPEGRLSLVTFSTKRNRVYPRRFDHDEARSLRARGWSYRRIADKFGVTDNAVARVCDQHTRERMDANTMKLYYRKKRPCLGGCGRLVGGFGKSSNGKPRTGYCLACVMALNATIDVRDGELRCTSCREWKPDEAFPTGRSRKVIKARRNRYSECRECSNARRKKHRQEHPEQEAAAARLRRYRKGQPIRVSDRLYDLQRKGKLAS